MKVTAVKEEAIDQALAAIHLQQRARAKEIYCTVMRFLEGKHQSNTGPLQDLLEIPVQHSVNEPYNPAATPMHVLRFRRVSIMGQAGNTAYAQSVDREDLKIHYDPNWEVVDKLVELLNK